MDLETLTLFFTTNPSAKLLRSPHAPYIIYFLNRHFKIDGNLASPHSKLLQKLNEFLETLHDTEPDVLRDRAEVYLSQWSTGDSRWLNRYFDAQHAESVYELTSHTENVLKFLTTILERTLTFIGTESRLTRIIQTLSDIVVRGSADRDRRLAHLYAERDRISREIDSLEAGHVVMTHSPTAIRERFADVVTDLISLQGDFRAVEESFKSITRDVQQQHTESTNTRGNILGFALDAEERLKEDDQGASFQAFVRLVLSQSHQDELERIIAQLDEITELADQADAKHRVHGMVGNLSSEAEKVLRTTRRLSATLRRLLDTRASESRMRLASVLRDIQSAAVRHASDPPDVGVEVYTEIDLLNVFQRTFWQAPVEFDKVVLVENRPDEHERCRAFELLAEMRRLDWDTMRSNIETLTACEKEVCLADLLQKYPPDGGAIEILAYVQLAHDDGHKVDATMTDVICLGASEQSTSYEIPDVIFVPRKMRLTQVTQE